MKEVNAILRDLKAGAIKPIYFLMGDEPFFIDQVSDYIGDHLLNDMEKEFNQTVLYGRDTSIEQVIGAAKRYPMMAERQVVIVKEAQHLSRTIEQLASYVENPQATTVLVICYKYKVVDGRKKLGKLLKKSPDAVLLTSKQLYDDKVPDWIMNAASAAGYTISPKAANMLYEYLGKDLSRIQNELKKLQSFLDKGAQITPELIEKYIGISKDYNNFELRDALANRDVVKATRIINYFAQNPKDNPYVLTISSLSSFYTQLLQYHGLTDQSKESVASALKISPFFVNKFRTAAKNYPMKEVSRILGHLRTMDVKGKGVGASNIPQADLLKELLVGVI